MASEGGRVKGVGIDVITTNSVDDNTTIDLAGRASPARTATTRSPEEIANQVNRTQSVISAATGVTPRLLRPPYGAVNATVSETVGLPQILWSVDPQDWKDRNAQIVANRVITATQPGAIIVLHDIHSTSVDAVGPILDNFTASGIAVVTVSDLLGPNLVPGATYRDNG